MHPHVTWIKISTCTSGGCARDHVCISNDTCRKWMAPFIAPLPSRCFLLFYFVVCDAPFVASHNWSESRLPPPGVPPPGVAGAPADLDHPGSVLHHQWTAVSLTQGHLERSGGFTSDGNLERNPHVTPCGPGGTLMVVRTGTLDCL